MIPLDGGVWRHELAGTGDAAAAHAGLVAALGGPDGWMALRDPAAGMFRAARSRTAGWRPACSSAPTTRCRRATG